jgi:sugar phosphate isomerase/epimerase
MNLAAQDEKVRSRSIEVCIKAIDLCACLDSPLYSFHPGFRIFGTLKENFGLEPLVSYEAAYKAFSSSLEELLSFSKERGIRIAVENLEHKNDAYMMTRPEEFYRLQENFTELGVLLDLSNLKIASRRLGFEIEDFIYSVAYNVAGIHLHENDGLSDQHLEPLNGTMPSYLDQIACRMIILECRDLSMERTILNSRALNDYFDHEKDSSMQETSCTEGLE